MTLQLLNVIGIPDDNRIHVAFNDGSLRQGAFLFPGNNAFIEQFDVNDMAMQSLVLGGASQSRQVPLQRFDLIFNSVCNPDIQHKSLELLEGFVKTSGVPIINAPQAVRNSSRSRCSELLQELDGIVMPLTLRISPECKYDVSKAIKEGGLSYPVLFRPANEHGGRELSRIDSEHELDTLDAYALDGRPYYLTQYVEYASADGLYRKCRYIVAGEAVIARHLIISRQWKVHTAARAELIEQEQRYRDEEIAFVTTAVDPKIQEAARKIKKRIGLDIFGIDAHIRADGSLMLFEVNACMRYFGQRQNNYIDKVTDTITEAIVNMIRMKT